MESVLIAYNNAPDTELHTFFESCADDHSAVTVLSTIASANISAMYSTHHLHNNWSVPTSVHFEHIQEHDSHRHHASQGSQVNVLHHRAFENDGHGTLP